MSQRISKVKAEDDIKTPENIRLVLFQNIQKFLTYCWPMLLFYTPWKQQKTKGFLVFSGDIK